MTWKCSGCNRPYLRECDLVQHFNKSTRPKTSPPGNDNASTSSLSQPAPEDVHMTEGDQDAGELEPKPVPFEGDFFGDDYCNEDFPFDGEGGHSTLLDLSREAPLVNEVSDDEEEGFPEVLSSDCDVPTAQAGPSLTFPVRPFCQCAGQPSQVGESQPIGQQPDGSGTGPDPHATLSAPGNIPPPSHEQLRTAPSYIHHFGGRAGTPISPQTTLTSAYDIYGKNVEGSTENVYAPFRSELDWKIAQWAKTRSPTSNAFSDLLAIKGVVESLGLSYKNANELNAIIDMLPHQCPAFSRFEATAMGETFEMYARPILECIIALWHNPEHARYLCFAPERHYADMDKTIRLYHDLHTGKWWWSVQKHLEADKPGATVVPIIISSDKTQVTLFRNKTAYPVYLTIGNLPKAIRQKPGRQGQILLAYLPTTRLDHITTQAIRRRTLANLFHACMKTLLAPLESAGVEGIGMMSGDGVTRRCHPILAAYVGDYPEQCLVSCAYTGDCPICECPHDDLGVFPPPYPLRNFEAARDAVKMLVTDPDRFGAACLEANIKAVQHPFWEDLPYTDIFQSITVDVLHQLHQGVFKHLVAWLKLACGTSELDARIAWLPPNHSVRIFYKGISNLARVSGAEHRQISRFILGVICDMDLPGGRVVTAQLTRATRALLDFVFMAQYPIHSDDTLTALDNALSAFHADRDVFETLGIRTGFNIPKLHSLAHYVRCIKLFGTTDNYSTETSERLHIDFTKDAYQATNHKDEYPQMTRWLERREKISHHANYVLWRQQQVEDGSRSLVATHTIIRWQPPDLTSVLQLKMTRHPTRKSVPLTDLTSITHYGARYLIPALARFVVQWRHPTFNARRVEYHAEDVVMPFKSLPVYHRIKFWNEAIYGNETIDSIHVHPRSAASSADNAMIPGRFNTALVRIRPSPASAASVPSVIADLRLIDTRIAQVRVVFTLPGAALDYFFPTLQPHQRPPRHLAYVEWFSKFANAPDRNSRMFKVTRTLEGGERVGSIIPVSLIERSVHLIPKWSGAVPRAWTSENVLEECSTFYVNPFKDAHTYFNLY
ncbi:hypothetical protein BD413DRAFT_697536 [Trametes elegans]|nr:hypothetical protein BD413DRAFT_697536 [Trametes elegans]